MKIGFARTAKGATIPLCLVSDLTPENVARHGLQVPDPLPAGHRYGRIPGVEDHVEWEAVKAPEGPWLSHFVVCEFAGALRENSVCSMFHGLTNRWFRILLANAVLAKCADTPPNGSGAACRPRKVKYNFCTLIFHPFNAPSVNHVVVDKFQVSTNQIRVLQ